MKDSSKKTTAKKVVKRQIGNKQLSQNLPNEVKAVIDVIKNNTDKANVPFETLFNEFKTELKKYSNSNSNLKTRFRRCLYRNIEGAIIKDSLQAVKFNIKANIQGITIKSKNPIEYKVNGDAVTTSVDKNFYSFKVAKTQRIIKETKIDEALLNRINKFKEEASA